MRRLWLVVMLVSMLPALAQSANESQPVLSKDALNTDQIAIYRTFLKQYDNGGEKPLHVANRTIALVSAERDEADEDPEAACLKGVKIVWDKQAIGVEHILDSSLAVPGRVVLVDPEQQADVVKANDPAKTMREGKASDDAVDKAFSTGLLTLSEVAFDAQHRTGVMSFSFSCGRLCGHGAILLFRKRRGQWTVSKKPCLAFIS